MSPRRPEQEERAAPIDINPARPVTLSLAILLTLLGATVTGALGFAAISSRLDSAVAGGAAAKVDNAETRGLVVKSEERIRALEAAQIKVAEMARDVEWLRKSYEEDRRSRGPGR